MEDNKLLNLLTNSIRSLHTTLNVIVTYLEQKENEEKNQKSINYLNCEMSKFSKFFELIKNEIMRTAPNNKQCSDNSQRCSFHERDHCNLFQGCYGNGKSIQCLKFFYEKIKEEPINKLKLFDNFSEEINSLQRLYCYKDHQRICRFKKQDQGKNQTICLLFDSLCDGMKKCPECLEYFYEKN